MWRVRLNEEYCWSETVLTAVLCLVQECCMSLGGMWYLKGTVPSWQESRSATDPSLRVQWEWTQSQHTNQSLPSADTTGPGSHPLRSICIRSPFWTHVWSHEHLTKRAEDPFDPAFAENWRTRKGVVCWTHTIGYAGFLLLSFFWPNMKVGIANKNDRRSWFSSFYPACGLWELVGRFWPCFLHLADWKKRCFV